MLKAEVSNLYRARATERGYFMGRASLETLYWAGGHSISFFKLLYPKFLWIITQ